MRSATSPPPAPPRRETERVERGTAWLGVQLCLALVLVLTGVTIAAAGGLVTGLLLALLGAAWVSRSYRRL